MRMSIEQDLWRERDEVVRICRRHGVARAWVFGSAVRGEAGLDGDLDLLVERATGADGRPERKPWWPGGLIAELADLLSCKVDVVTEAGLHPLLRTAVHREKQEL